MRVVIQRVSEAAVQIEGKVHGAIEKGLLILVGIEHEDEEEDVKWLSKKIVNLRIFNDDTGKMNHSLLDISGRILVISQFTLHAKTKKGNRPSYIKAAHPDIAIPIYEKFIGELETLTQQKVEAGVFGADMKVSLTNDGPVTIIIDSKVRQ